MSHRHAQQFRSAHPAGHDNRRSPHFDQQGGTRVAGSIGARVSVAGPAVERDSDPPDLTPAWAARVWKKNGDPVVYEYKDGRRLAQLSYPSKELSRNYYKVGDVFLVADIEKRYAEMELPELKEPGDGDSSVLELFMTLLGIYEEEKYKLGWKIVLISELGYGGGYVGVRRVIFFDNLPVALKEVGEWNGYQLNTQFIQARTARQLESLVPVLEFTAELSETLLGGALEQIEKVAAKRLLKETARAAMKRGLKKAFNRTLRTLASALGKTVLAFLKAFAKEFWKDMHAAEKEHSLKQRVGAPNLPKEIEHHPIFKKAILAGADAAALAFIGAALEAPMMKMLDKSFTAMYPGVEKTLSQRAKIYFTKEFVKVCTTEFASDIADALVSSWKESLDASGKADQEKFAKLVSDKLLSSLTKAFSKRFDSFLEKISEQMFEDMKF
ncbi:MAG TPA: hypothetical protein VE077_21105 [Candidatus Methylomirabilis sp.]|nr:hypothetical protein [Candidatus Methylomirabilis sp.]